MSRAIKRILAGVGGLLLGLSTPLLAVQSYAPALEPNQANAYSSQQLSEQQLRQLARAITVKVLSGQGWGSGILVEKQGASYKVLTNDHVLGRYRYRGWQIQTPDGKIHRGELVRTVRLNDYDLGLVSFRSSRVYSIADLANVDDLAIGDEVFAAGFPPELGYEIVYSYSFCTQILHLELALYALTRTGLTTNLSIGFPLKAASPTTFLPIFKEPLISAP